MGEKQKNGRKSRRICNSDHLHSSRRRSFERAPEKKADNKTDKGIFFLRTWPLESILESRSKRRLHIDGPWYKSIVFSSTVIQPLRVPYKKAISFLREQLLFSFATAISPRLIRRRPTERFSFIIGGITWLWIMPEAKDRLWQTLWQTLSSSSRFKVLGDFPLYTFFQSLEPLGSENFRFRLDSS